MPLASIRGLSIIVEIGGMPILVRTDNTAFADMLRDRYREFALVDASHPVMELDIELMPGPSHDSVQGSEGGASRVGNSIFGDDVDADADASVRVEAGRWIMERGDFRAEWDPQTHRGWVRQSMNPYSIDGVLRILHSLILAREGGFLVHGASAVRNGRAFVFAGVSGAGKTTLARLAPPDVTLLTDEISYIRPQEQGTGGRGQGTVYRVQETGGGSEEPEVRSPRFGVRRPDSKFKIADFESRIPKPEPRTANPESLTPDTQHLTPSFSAYGTPFAGELARIGEKVQAPLAMLFLLKQGPENRIEPVGAAQAARELLRHVLFFAHDEELVRMIFQTVCDFVRRVPVRRLEFTPDARVWELIA